jgi:hypothetical protein
MDIMNINNNVNHGIINLQLVFVPVHGPKHCVRVYKSPVFGSPVYPYCIKYSTGIPTLKRRN